MAKDVILVVEMKTKPRHLKLATICVVAASAMLGLVACTAILGDFTTSAQAGDGGPTTGDGSPQGDGGPQNEGGPAPGAFTFETIPTATFVQPRETVQIQIAATLNQFSAPITVTVTGLPANVTAAPLDIAAGAAAGQLVLTASASATVGAHAKATVAATGGGVTAPPQSIDVTVSGATGTLDTSYPATQPFTALGTINSALAQPDGKIILIGTFHKTVGDAPSLVVRLNADATIDSTFTQGAIATSASASPIGTGVKGLLQSDGKIIVAWTEGANSHLNISRVLTTGALDPGWNNPSTATVSTNDPFVTASPQVVALAEDDTGEIVYAQYVSASSAQGWRFTSDGNPDTRLGSPGNYGFHTFASTPSQEPLDSITTVQSIFPQSGDGGTSYVFGYGTAGPSAFIIPAQILARTSATYVPDTTFGPSGEKFGWDYVNGYAKAFESVQLGSVIYTAVANTQTCSSQVDFCVTSVALGAADVGATEGPICPTSATGLGCTDLAVRIASGPQNTLLVGGWSTLAGGLAVVARYTTAPLAVDTSFGTTGVTKLRAGTSNETSGTPSAVLPMPDGTTLVFDHDATYPIQRVWP